MSIESVIPSHHLILCHPVLLLPLIFPSIRVFFSELALHPYFQGSLYSVPTIKPLGGHCIPNWILTSELLHQKIHKCSYCVKIVTVSCIILHDPHRSYQIRPKEIRLEGWQGRRKKWERQETRGLTVGGRRGGGQALGIRFHAL